MSAGVLYISYTGMLEPLGESQVLAYQEHLARRFRVHIISFERPEDWGRQSAREAMSTRMAAAGIAWHPLRYHKRPSAIATAWDIATGTLCGLYLVIRHRLGIVHARSYVSSVMALMIKRVTGAKYIFDMRGFWADERVDGGLWTRDGRKYRVAKRFESKFLLNADHVVSLTHAAVREMQRFSYLQGRMPPITVIPTCADLERFRPPIHDTGTREGDEFVLGYVGSAGTWYIFDAVAACFAALLRIRPHARLLVINRNEHDFVRAVLKREGVSMDNVEIRSASHRQMPDEMASMDAAAFFIKPLFSKQASAPTKLGELLGCGVPCLSNRGVGDMAELLEDERVGVALRDFSAGSMDEGVRRLLELATLPQTRARCVETARRFFSLEQGVASYLKIYSGLTIK